MVRIQEAGQRVWARAPGGGKPETRAGMTMHAWAAAAGRSEMRNPSRQRLVSVQYSGSQSGEENYVQSLLVNGGLTCESSAYPR